MEEQPDKQEQPTSQEHSTLQNSYPPFASSEEPKVITSADYRGDDQTGPSAYVILQLLFSLFFALPVFNYIMNNFSWGTDFGDGLFEMIIWFYVFPILVIINIVSILRKLRNWQLEKVSIIFLSLGSLLMIAEYLILMLAYPPNGLYF